MHAAQLVVGNHTLDLALREITGGLVIVNLCSQKLQDSLAALNLIFYQLELLVDLHKPFSMLIHKLYHLLAGSLLDGLDAGQLPLQRHKVDFGTLLALLALLAQCQQIGLEVEVFRLQLSLHINYNHHPIHQNSTRVTQSTARSSSSIIV